MKDISILDNELQSLIYSFYKLVFLYEFLKTGDEPIIHHLKFEITTHIFIMLRRLLDPTKQGKNINFTIESIILPGDNFEI